MGQIEFKCLWHLPYISAVNAIVNADEMIRQKLNNWVGFLLFVWFLFTIAFWSNWGQSICGHGELKPLCELKSGYLFEHLSFYKVKFKRSERFEASLLTGLHNLLNDSISLSILICSKWSEWKIKPYLKLSSAKQMTNCENLIARAVLECK